jgi:hypothetical protein
MRFLTPTFPALALLALALRSAEPPRTGGPPCGTMPNKPQMLRGFTRYFVEDRYALMRGDSIQQLDSAHARAIVADTAVCRAVLNAALREMRAHAPAGPRWRRRDSTTRSSSTVRTTASCSIHPASCRATMLRSWCSARPTCGA